MGDIQYIDAAHVTVHNGRYGEGKSSMDGWEMLLTKTAPNALHNSRARYDAPKCDEDTRVEVTSEIMAFIEDSEGPRRLLCLTGAAGSGKSALQQTIAGICSGKGSLAASYFFSATDISRNTVNGVIPTIAYQLGTGTPAVKALIKAAIENDPLIFTKSLEDQITNLIVEPYERLNTIGSSIGTLPCAILIDGLDECTGEDAQAELLISLRKCLLVGRLPFRIFIASRPEWAIRTALQPGGHLHHLAYHIQLSDHYDASGDMHRYLRRRFEAIGLSIGDPQWFTEENIETLVRAASGQFIYAATAYKYVSERRGSPAVRLQIILSWTPHAGHTTRPFDALDRLYTNILLSAKQAYEAIDSHDGRNFLLLLRAHHININGFNIYHDKHRLSANNLSERWLGLEARAEEILISDLHSLVAIKKDTSGSHHLHLYHKSFSDFLEEESRAKDLFVPEVLVHAHIAKCFMQRINGCQLDFHSVPDKWDKWDKVPLPKSMRVSLALAVDFLPALLSSIAAASESSLDDEVCRFTKNNGWHKIDKLLPLMYYQTDGLNPWHRRFERWLECLRQFVDSVKTRIPDEEVVVLNQFVTEWERDKDEWRFEWRKNGGSDWD
ncbi:hypothetical protein MD484_g2598, partial [Candolleomyces efflorescens]